MPGLPLLLPPLPLLFPPSGQSLALWQIAFWRKVGFVQKKGNPKSNGWWSFSHENCNFESHHSVYFHPVQYPRPVQSGLLHNWSTQWACPERKWQGFALFCNRWKHKSCRKIWLWIKTYQNHSKPYPAEPTNSWLNQWMFLPQIWDFISFFPHKTCGIRNISKIAPCPCLWIRQSYRHLGNRGPCGHLMAGKNEEKCGKMREHLFGKICDWRWDVIDCHGSCLRTASIPLAPVQVDNGRQR